MSDTCQSQAADYVRGALADNDREELELALLSGGRSFEAVQFEWAMRRGLQFTELSVESSLRGRLPGWLQPSAWLTVGLLLAVAVLGSELWSLQIRFNQLQQPLAGIPVITLQQQRSVFEEQSSLSQRLGPSDAALLEIDVSGYSSSEFLVEIDYANGRRYQRRFQTDQRGYLTVFTADARSLKRVRVSGADGRSLTEYSFTTQGGAQ